jgi:hypothetical protein
MTAARLQRMAKANLERQVMEFQVDVQKQLSRILKKPVVLRPGWVDAVRLFNLRMLCARYQITLAYALEVLVAFWTHAKHNKGKEAPKGFGTRIANLIGPTSRKVLEESILRDFPNRENESQQRVSIEDAFLLSEEVMGPVGDFRLRDPFSFVKAYKSRITQAKKGLEALEESLSSRQWRGNPYRKQ